MSIEMNCSKCGGPITVDDETVKLALEGGHPLKPQHEVCPSEEVGPDRRFHIVVTVHEVNEEFDGEEDLLASFGGRVTATSFTAAVPKLADELNKSWEQVQQLGPVIDG